MKFEQYQKKVGQKIKEIRVSKNLTQMDFDMEPNAIPVRTLQDVENGRSNVTLKTLFNIAAKLKIHPKDLIDI